MHVSQQNIQLHFTASVCHADWHSLVFKNASNEHHNIPVLRLRPGWSRQLEVRVGGFPRPSRDPRLPPTWALLPPPRRLFPSEQKPFLVGHTWGFGFAYPTCWGWLHNIYLSFRLFCTADLEPPQQISAWHARFNSKEMPLFSRSDSPPHTLQPSQPSPFCCHPLFSVVTKLLTL